MPLHELSAEQLAAVNAHLVAEGKAPIGAVQGPRRGVCRHLGRAVRAADAQPVYRDCGCAQQITLPVFTCALHGDVTDADCQRCLDWVAR